MKAVDQVEPWRGLPEPDAESGNRGQGGLEGVLEAARNDQGLRFTALLHHVTEGLLRGYFNYHAVPGNCSRLRSFRHDVIRHWWQAVRRRRQRPLSRAMFDRIVALCLPTPAILHTYPLEWLAPTIRDKNRVR